MRKGVSRLGTARPFNNRQRIARRRPLHQGIKEIHKPSQLNIWR